MKAPCKDCTERQLYCHSVCDKYLAFRQEKQKEYKEKILKGSLLMYDAKLRRADEAMTRR